MDRAKDIEENGKEYNRPDFLVADGSVINTGPRDAGTEGPEKMPSDKGSKQGRNKNFLVVYAMTLLSIAFVLVLLSYLSTMRANNSQIESLRQANEEYTVSAMKNIQSLQDENEELKDTAAKLEQQVKLQAQKLDEIEKAYDIVIQDNEKLKEENRIAAERSDDLRSVIEVSAAASRINELYSRKDYARAAYEISQIEGTDSDYVRKVLGGEDKNEMFSLLIERYYKNREQLEKKGYMDPEKIEEWYSENAASEAGNQ